MNYMTAPGVPKEEITVKKIIADVCLHFNVGERALNGSTRRQPIAIARQVSCYVIRNLLKYPLKKIAAIFNRDHTTIIHSIYAVEDGLTSKITNEYTGCINHLISIGYNLKPVRKGERIEVIMPKFQRVKGEYSNRSAMGIANPGG